jgi:hypothetical protein
VLRDRLGHDRLLMGVNLSARELLDPGLPAEIESATAAAGLERRPWSSRSPRASS